MQDRIDPRLVAVVIVINGKNHRFTDLNIVARGTKYASPTQNEAEVQLSNLKKSTMDFLLTETSPFNGNNTAKKIRIEAGRKSYGTTLIFQGDFISATVSQPPDLTLTLKTATENFRKGDIVSRSQLSQVPMRAIANDIASDLGLNLNYQVGTDKQIANYNYTGSSLKQVNNLNSLGDINAFVDDDSLVVAEENLPLPNTLRVLNTSNGMVGIPQITEKGVRVTFLIDNKTKLGGGLQIESAKYPIVNGNYLIYKLGFEITNRDTPFYYMAECKRI